jgi:hypothetical protein
MSIASPSSIARQLIEEIQAFAERNPKHGESVGALLRAVERIDREFEGEARVKLLTEARTTFLRQIDTLENAERTVAALEELKQNQLDLVEALKRIAYQRPADITLH